MSFNVELLVDYSKGVGFGHYQRCLSLAKAFDANGGRVKISSLFKDDIPSNNYNADFHTADIVIFDTHKSVEEVSSLKRYQNACKVMLDNFSGSSGDLNIYIYEHPGFPIAKRRLSGFHFVTIRNDILSVRETVEEDYILVSIGGEDINDSGEKISKLLLESGENVILVNGVRAKKSCSLKHPCFKFFHTPENYVDLMAGAKGLVTNAGGTLFEGLYLKKKVFVVPQTQMETNIAAELLKNEMILGVFSEENNQLSFNQKNVNELLIDGRGDERIVALAKEMLCTFKNV